MSLSKWDHRFIALAEHVAQWSKDPSTKVGTVIVNMRRQVLSLGFNGFPRGVKDDEARYAEKQVKYKLVVHAEANAIINANDSIRDCTIYSSKGPCSECAKLIVQAGIIDVICPPWSTDGIWAEDAEFAKTLLNEGGVYIRHV
jgi:dCMP deaminase